MVVLNSRTELALGVNDVLPIPTVCPDTVAENARNVMMMNLAFISSDLMLVSPFNGDKL